MATDLKPAEQKIINAYTDPDHEAYQDKAKAYIAGYKIASKWSEKVLKNKANGFFRRKDIKAAIKEIKSPEESEDSSKDEPERPAHQFQPGNQWWQVRTTHGRKRLFESPEALAEACSEYFEWVEANPLQEEKVFHAQGIITRANVSKMRAMTIIGLARFLGINLDTWYNWRKQNDFSEICAAAEGVIRQQKFEGAAADMLNHAIIARDLKLVETHEVTGRDGGPIQRVTREMSEEEASQIYKDNLRRTT